MTLPKPPDIFRRAVSSWTPKLIADFGLSEVDAAAILGNAGHESAGLTLMQEVNPIGGGRGGLGPFQWTGPRRRAYEAWLARWNGKPDDLDLAYAFLWRELHGDEKAAVIALKAGRSLADKVVNFERSYERAGVKSYQSRIAWAEVALDVWRKRPIETAAPAPPPRLEPVVIPLPSRRPMKVGELIDFIFG